MNKRPLATGTLVFVLGNAASLAVSNDNLYWFILAAAGFLLVAGFYSPFRLRNAAAFLVLFVLGFFLYRMADAKASWSVREDLDGHSAEITGIVKEKSYAEDRWVYTLGNACISSDLHSYQGNSVLLYYEDDQEFAIGNVLKAKGKISYFKQARNPGNFDARNYYHSKGIDFALQTTSLRLAKASQNNWKEGLYRAKEKVKSVYVSLLSEQDAGVLCTMVLGDKGNLDPDLRKLYQQSGISHILAISGLHISIVGMLLYGLLRKIGLDFWMAGIPVALLVTVYGSLSGMGLSTVRAITMCYLMLLGNALGRAYDSYTALSVAAFVLLLRNPLSIGQASFQLSFFAVFGAVYVNGRLAPLLNPKKHGVLSSMILCLSIQIGTLPVMLYHYYECSVYTILVNLLVLPFVSILLVLGILGGLLGLLCLPLSSLLFFPCHLILTGYALICKGNAMLPCTMLITGRPNSSQMLLYYFLLVLMLEVSRREIGKKYPKALLLLLMLGMDFMLLIYHRDTASFAMLDVGQGDAIFLSDGKGMHCFIDGGSSDVSEVGKYRILPYLKYKGIRSMDYWFVSHTDTDHMSGLLEILESGYKVKCLVFPSSLKETDENAGKLLREAKKHGTKVLFLSEGEGVQSDALSLKCLFPRQSDRFSDINDGCLVLELCYRYRHLLQKKNYRILLTGDLGSASEELLLTRNVLGDIDLLKVGHHGSKTASSDAFLRKIKAEEAWISVGAQNHYGHPSKVTLDRLENANIFWHRTDEEAYLCMTFSRMHGRIFGSKEWESYGKRS